MSIICLSVASLYLQIQVATQRRHYDVKPIKSWRNVNLIYNISYNFDQYLSIIIKIFVVMGKYFLSIYVYGHAVVAQLLTGTSHLWKLWVRIPVAPNQDFNIAPSPWHLQSIRYDLQTGGHVSRRTLRRNLKTLIAVLS
jgi:hypothetical protein